MKTRSTSFSPDLRRRVEFLHRCNHQRASFRHARASKERLAPQTLASEWCRSWAFPSEHAAQAWNDEWDAVLEDRNHLPEALVTIGGSPIMDRSFDMAARIVGAALADEVHAGMPCPYVERGWCFEIIARYQYLRISHQRTRSALQVVITTQMLGTAGESRWSTESVREYAPEEIPDSVAMLLASQRWKPVCEKYA